MNTGEVGDVPLLFHQKDRAPGDATRGDTIASFVALKPAHFAPVLKFAVSCVTDVYVQPGAGGVPSNPSVTCPHPKTEQNNATINNFVFINLKKIIF